MAFRNYKEGQGIWARGVIAGVIFILGVYASFRLYNYLYVDQTSWIAPLMQHRTFLGWTVDMRLIPVGILLVSFLAIGVWAYNYPKFVDFLIETETELRTRVTWPSRKELINASVVVVFAVFVIGSWVLISDNVFLILIRKGIYKLF